MIADITYGSGNHQKFKIGVTCTMDLDNVLPLLVAQFESDPVPTCGVDSTTSDSASGFAYTCVCAHRTGPEAAQGIAADGSISPSSWSGNVEGRELPDTMDRLPSVLSAHGV